MSKTKRKKGSYNTRPANYRPSCGEGKLYDAKAKKCRSMTQTEKKKELKIQAVAGAVAGGGTGNVVASQVKNKKTKNAMRIAGAIAGGVSAYRKEKRRQRKMK